MRGYTSVIFMGPHGSMKTKSAKLIAKKYKQFYHFSLGEILSSLKEKPNIFNYEVINVAMENRRHISSFLVNEVRDIFLGKAMFDGSYNPDKQTVILDGYPRNRTQYEYNNRKANIQKVIVFSKLDEKELIRRCFQRSVKRNREEDSDEKSIIRGIHLYEKYTLPILNLVDKKKYLKLMQEVVKKKFLVE